jgi:predicted Zn-dependent protease
MGCATSYNLATHKEEFILMSSQKEERIGSNLAEQVVEKFELEPDPLLQERVKTIGRKIAAVCDRRSIPYHFAVLADTDKVNAFSLPGGYVFIFTGMLDKMESDDELACVLAHEVGHIAARHSAKRAQGSMGDLFLRLAVARAKIDGATRARINEALNQLIMSYSRDDEILADKLAIKYARLAGYNPEGTIIFLERLMEVQRKAPLKPYYHYRSHPHLSERLSVAKEEVYGAMEFRDYINVSDDTLTVK